MFVRFRQTPRHLQASIVQAVRADGRVRQRHIAALGSVAVPTSPAARLAFWTKLHQRLSALGNRLDSAEQRAVMAAVHARIPMPTPDDRRAVQLEAAEHEARFWTAIGDASAEQAAGMKELATHTAHAAEKAAAAAAENAGKAAQAADRRARAERGEDLGQVGKELTRKDVLRITGWKPSEMRHALRMAELG